MLGDRSKVWLCVAPAAIIGIDVALTLAGQGSGYWSGSYNLANEASPPGYYLLTQHPAAFIAAMAAWVGLLCLTILLLPATASRILSLALVIGHTWGATSWFRYVFDWGYWSSIVFFALAAASVVFTWDRARQRD